MSQDFNSTTIQRDIDAKKAKLEALRQARLKRQSMVFVVHDGEGDTPPGALSPAVFSPNESFDGGDLDRNLSISAVVSPSNGPSLNASFHDGHPSANVSALLSPPRGPSAQDALSPPSMTRGFSKARLSTSVANTEQLQAIKHSLDEIAQHSAAPPPTFATRRLSMTPDMMSLPGQSKSPPPPPPPPATAPPNEPAHESTNGSLDPSTTNSVAPSPDVPSHSFHLPTASTDVHPVPPESNEQIDELLEQIQQLSEQVRSNREDLQMAGDLGSVLLANNEEANQKIDELQTMLDQSNHDTLLLKDELRAADRRAKKLQMHLAEMQHLKEESESEVDVLKLELELERQRVRAGEIELLRVQSDRSQEEANAELSVELSEAKASQSKLEASVAGLQRQRDELVEEAKVLKFEATELRAELSIAEKHQHRARELAEQLAALRSQDTVNVITELQYENQRLQDALAELHEHYSQLQEANTRDQDLLRSLQGNKEELQREYDESKLTTQRAPKPFDSLADDEVLEDGTPAAVGAASLSQADKDEVALRAATAAAAMHLGSMSRRKSGVEPLRSSLASGSASLAYPDGASGVTADSPLRPIAPSAHAGLPPTHLGALSPAVTGAMSVPGTSASKPGMFGFIGSLLPHQTTPGGGANSATKKLNFERTTAHPLSGGGGLQFDPNMKLVQYPPPSSSVGSAKSGQLWDDSDLPVDDGKERNSSHASTITGRKAGERDADFEFFALTLLCVKIHSARKMESLYTVSTQDLWLRAKQEDIQFHQYYPWLEEQLTKAYVSKLAAQKKSKGGARGNAGEWEETVLDSYLPSNSNVSAIASVSPPSHRTINTAATRLQMHTPSAIAPNLANLGAAVVRNVNSSPTPSPAASPVPHRESAMMSASDDNLGANM